MAINKSNMKNIAFGTNFIYEEVEVKGHVDTTLGSTATIVHNLGYTPFSRIFYLFPGAGVFPATTSATSPYVATVKPDAYKIDVQMAPGLFGANGNAVTVYYRIYRGDAMSSKYSVS